MEVLVKIWGKEYTYSEVDGYKTWRNSAGKEAPLSLHAIFREVAITNGVSTNTFISNGVITANGPSKKNKQLSATKVKKIKNGLKGGFNPFK